MAADSLGALWISCNQVDKLKPLWNLVKLIIVLYVCHDQVRERREFEFMCKLPCLEDLVFGGNPLEEELCASASTSKYTDEVTRRLLYLQKLDDLAAIRESAEEAT